MRRRWDDQRPGRRRARADARAAGAVGGGRDLALELGKYLIRGDGGRLIDAGKFMAVLRRDPDGWRLYRDMYNSSLETRSPLEVPDYLPPPAGTWSGEFD